MNFTKSEKSIQAYEALNSLNPSCSRDYWVKVAMASKSALLTFDDFHDWSKFGDNYKSEKDCRNVWDSIEQSGPITEATLYALAHKNMGWSCKTEPSSNKKAIDIWNAGLVVNEVGHDYINNKMGRDENLKVCMDQALSIQNNFVFNYLMVPLWEGDYLQSIQFIPPGPGKKLNLPGTSFNNGYFTVGEIKDGQPIYICEGIGQAWSVVNALGQNAIVTFGSGRMLKITKLIMEKYKAHKVIIVSDRGMELAAEKIAKELNCFWIELPNDKPSNYDVNDYAQEHGFDALMTILRNVKSPPIRFNLHTADYFMNLPPMKWIIQKVLPQKGLSCIFGASGSGKSFLALDMAINIAHGDEKWFGFNVTKHPVTYICLEGEEGLGKRLKAWIKHNERAIPDTLRFVNEPFTILSDDPIDFTKSVMLNHQNNGVVIIDTLNRAAPESDENSSKDMGRIISACKTLQDKVGGIILLVHHNGKDASKGLRGHSSLFACLDTVIEVKKDNDQRYWKIAKSKDDIEGQPRAFGLKGIQIGLDDYNDPIYSCAVVNQESVLITEKVKAKKITKASLNRDVALKIIRNEMDARNLETILLSDVHKQIFDAIDVLPKYKDEKVIEYLEYLAYEKKIVLNRPYISWPN